jgi:hypothetical protein
MDTLQSAQTLLTDWANSGADPGTLLDWLQGGEDMGVLGIDLPPYYRIMSAIPDQGDDQRAVRQALAKSVAKLLERKPDENPKFLGADHEETFANLLYLAAGLASPSILSGPLLAMNDRKRLSGSWNEHELRDVLRDALIENQPDSKTLKPTWETLLRAQGAECLQGDSFDGFRGLVKATDRPGQPDVGNIATAVGLLAEYLDTHRGETRRAEFKQWTRQIDHYFPLRELREDEWLKVAEDARLRRWAAESLPKLARRSRTGTLVVWAPIVSCIPFDWKPVRPLCDGAALELEPSPEARDFIFTVWPVFERSRLDFVADSPSAQFCMLNQIFMDLEKEWRDTNRDRFAAFIRTSREHLLREALAERADDPMELKAFGKICEQLAADAKRRFSEASMRDKWTDLAKGAASVCRQPWREIPRDDVEGWAENVYRRAAHSPI